MFNQVDVVIYMLYRRLKCDGKHKQVLLLVCLKKYTITKLDYDIVYLTTLPHK